MPSLANYATRIPLITASGAQWLHGIEEHPHAPRFTHPGIDRLTPAGLRRVQAFAEQIRLVPPQWSPNTSPEWVKPFVAQAYAKVPFYRRQGSPPANFFDTPPTPRSALSTEPWAFVPDDQPLDGLTVYHTSGVTGHPLAILTHADSLALYLPLLEAALADYGITVPRGAGQTAIVLVCFQKETYTYAATTAVLENAGFIKVNLNPADWRDPADGARFLDACAPAIITGDPVAFHALANLPLTHQPRALVSTAMALLPGLQKDLENRFHCPVVDVYGLNETGPLGVRVGEQGSRGAEASGLNHQSPITTHRLLQPHLYVEILTPDDTPLPPGERGEIVVTGGFNPFLPLIRYRTGDYAALEFVGQQPYLVNLEGRAPVVFVSTDGRAINNIDVTMALRPLALPQFQLHQARDGTLTLRLPHLAQAQAEAARQNLLTLFGPQQPLTVQLVAELESPNGKLLQYQRDSRS